MGDLDLFVEDGRPSWLALLDLLSQSFAAPRVLPADGEVARASLVQLQVAATSPLGAIALNSGGILLYDGWLRIFGGSPCAEVGLPSIGQINDFPVDVDPGWTPTQGVIVAHDVLGGVFFLNGLRPGVQRPGVPGEVIYFDPSSLEWTRMGMSHGEWLTWCLSGDLPNFYGDLLWPRWREDVMGLRADQGIAVHPSLLSREEVTRVVAPMVEILNCHLHAARSPGQRFDGALGRYPAVQPSGVPAGEMS
ncbi:DUF2625 family protein [Actinoplanes solisilvae]|uniref:DUF2625 family protein n=1 Tax=Actinoplanes solisilvae TaxID=2486853 RepID=UPI000FDBAC46|nr:DUF2625 family protein [Actinoplanes solisilvae]